jgi:diguanylate cyclase (GGDEF)-like protein
VHAYIQNLYRSGADQAPESQRARIQVGNLMAGMGIVITMLYGLVYLGIGLTAPFALHTICALSYTLYFVLVRRGWPTVARLYLCMVCFTDIGVLLWMVGPASNFQSYFILGGPVALVLFESREARLRWLTAGTSMLLYVAAEMLPFQPLLEAPTHWVYRFMTLTSAPTIVGILIVIQGVFLAEIQRREDALERAAHTDVLTGLPNRRHAVERAQAMFTQARHQGHALALMMIDVDHFKRVNDTHGHAAGDALLVSVAHALRARLRAEDMVARMGGEEFMVALNQAPFGHEATVAEALRERIAAVQLALPEGVILHCTASVGIATLGNERTLDELMVRADAALYRAKADGRNCVRSANGTHIRTAAANEAGMAVVPPTPPRLRNLLH